MKKVCIISALAIFFVSMVIILEPIIKAEQLKKKFTQLFTDKGENLTKVTRVIEESAVGDYVNGSSDMPGLSTSESRYLSLGEVTVDELVIGTYYPFGEAEEEEDKEKFDRFREITVITPGTAWYDVHPSDSEVASYRSSLISSAISSKEQAYRTWKETQEAAGKEVGEEPDFSLTDEELGAIDRAVSEWYEENSYIEERNEPHFTVFSGEQVREYVNSYHPEWQVAYTLSLLIEYYHDTNIGDDETQISKEVAEKACVLLTEDYDFELMIDYWSEEWGDYWSEDGRTLILGEEDLWTSYEDKASGSAVDIQLFDRYEIDYTNNRLESDPDLRRRVWIEPFVLFRSVDAWSEDLTFKGRETSQMNEFGYYQQDINSKSVGSIFLEIVSLYDFPQSELMIMRDAIEAMPESRTAYDKWSYCMGELESSGGYLVDRGNIKWLTGNDIGTNVARLALEQVGAVYSNDRRNEDGYFDCSSLTHYLYKTYGINIAWQGSDVAAAQCQWCDKRGKTKWEYYNESAMRPGDLIFWQTYNTNHPSYSRYKHVYHVGVYIGNGVIVDASSSVGCVVCRQMWGIDKIVAVARPYE